jgi:mRNA interferase HigB
MRAWNLNVISATTIKRYAALHADATAELLRWKKAASHAVWRDVHEVRLHFPDADRYKSLLIFNIRHNYYRLIVKVDYRAKLLMVKEFLTHKEYSRGGCREPNYTQVKKAQGTEDSGSRGARD